MHVLALDSTTRAGSVALVTDDRIVLKRSGDPTRTHAERLPGDILGLLHDAGVALAAVDVFAIASGPGSFTGLRIGIATLQGLAFVLRFAANMAKEIGRFLIMLYDVLIFAPLAIERLIWTYRDGTARGTKLRPMPPLKRAAGTEEAI